MTGRSPTVARIEAVPVADAVAPPAWACSFDRDALAAAHERHREHGLGTRHDAVAMQYLVPGWRFDPKRPCLVR